MSKDSENAGSAAPLCTSFALIVTVTVTTWPAAGVTFGTMLITPGSEIAMYALE